MKQKLRKKTFPITVKMIFSLNKLKQQKKFINTKSLARNIRHVLPWLLQVIAPLLLLLLFFRPFQQSVHILAEGVMLLFPAVSSEVPFAKQSREWRTHPVLLSTSQRKEV